MIPRQFLFAFFILHSAFCVSFASAQHLSTQNKKAEKWFYSAVDSYQSRLVERATGEVGKAIEEDPS